MTAYCDASLLVSAFNEEVTSDLAEQWFAALAPGDLVSSVWVTTEVASALAAKVRSGVITDARRDELFAAMTTLLRLSSRMLTVQRDDFEAAAALLLRSEKPLRGADALHLAIADRAGATLWTLDRRMAEAGQALGLDARRPS